MNIEKLHGTAVEGERKARDIKYMIRALENMNRVIRTDLDVEGNNRFKDRLADVDKRIDALLKLRQRMVERHENGWELLERNKARIAELKKELSLVTSGNALVKLLTLLKQVNEMKQEIDPKILAANLGHLSDQPTDEEDE